MAAPLSRGPVPAPPPAHRVRGGGAPGRSAGGLAERIPAVGTRFSVRSSDGTIEEAGADVVHFPFQDAFTTEVPSLYQPHDLQHLHLPELFSPWIRKRREAIYRTHCERADGGGGDDLLGPPRLHRELRAPRGEGLGRARAPRCCPSTRPRARGPRRRSGRGSRCPTPSSSIRRSPGPTRTTSCCSRRSRWSGSGPGRRSPWSAPAPPPGHFHQVRDRAVELGFEQTMIFPGFVSPKELRGLYELATALVFPSRFEGWGLPVCEAFSAGLPVASSSATGLPDLVGDAGLIFDPESTERIADAVQQIWTDEEPAADLAERGRERGELFSWEDRPPLPRPLPPDRRAEPCRGRPYPSGGSASRLNAGISPTWTPDLRQGRRLRAPARASSPCSPRSGGSLGSSTRSSSATGSSTSTSRPSASARRRSRR